MAGGVCSGSWSCENAKTRDLDRRGYSSETPLALNRASALNLTNELKNVILAAFRSFAFPHSQGQNLRRSLEGEHALGPGVASELVGFPACLSRALGRYSDNPYAAPFCTTFAFDARIGGNVTCSNAARLLR